MTLLLAIETSCDETAAAVIEDGRLIRSNVVATQIDLHRRYGGVFPEVASRQHVLSITPVIEEALTKAAVVWTDLDAIAVTEGPGLVGSLLVGVNAAKAIAFMRGLPLVAVNHLEGHVYSNWLAVAGGKLLVAGGTSDDLVPPAHAQADLQPATLPLATPQFPILVLIVSGGHTELVLMEEHGRYRRLGGTLDDAAGEAFDKAARLLGLPYPGGPMVQRAAEGGNPRAFALPRALLKDPAHRYNFSFSGLKTAVLRVVREQGAEGALRVATVCDIAASFQTAVADALVTKTLAAAQDFGVAHVCVCGGVAANGELRRQLAERMALPYSIPPLWLCTDNAAMIGAAAHYRFVAGIRAGWDLDVKARLPLASWN